MMDNLQWPSALPRSIYISISLREVVPWEADVAAPFDPAGSEVRGEKIRARAPPDLLNRIGEDGRVSIE